MVIPTVAIILVGMTVRIPSSLNWLVNKRARLDNEIRKASAALVVQTNAAEAYIQVLKSDLEVIDKALRLHEVKLDPTLIPPINTQTSARKFKHGAMTRAIFSCLKNNKNRALSTTEIAMFVAGYAQNGSNENFPEIRYSVGHQLKKLASKGKVERVPRSRTSVETYWTLSDWAELSVIGRPIKVSKQLAIPLPDGDLGNILATNEKDHS